MPACTSRPRDVEEPGGAVAGAVGNEASRAAGHFFELGGHSLLAVSLQARIWRVLRVELPIDCYSQPTLGQLAAAVQEAGRGKRGWSPIGVISRKEPLPLSFAQQRLWFLAQLEGVSQTYHIPGGIATAGEVGPGGAQAQSGCGVWAP